MALLDSNRPHRSSAAWSPGRSSASLGWRWRAARSWSSAALLAAAFCLEPLARLAAGRLYGPGLVWVVEVALGVSLAGFFAVAGAVGRRST